MFKRGSLYFQQYSRSIVSSGSNSGRQIGIIGVPLSDGQNKSGAELGPDAIRNAGLEKMLRRISGDLQIKDYGNITYTPDPKTNYQNMKNYENVMGCNRALFNKVNEALRENNQILTLGGDHSMAIGSVLGHLAHDPEICLIWVDAHADINLNVTSGSGNIHGMPVSFFIEELRNSSEKSPQLTWTNNRIPARKIVYIGLRDIDPFESTILKKLGIAAFAMNHVDKLGMPSILEMISEILDARSNSKIHISFDIDGLDPSEAPSTGTPVRGGLTLREGIQIMEHFAQTERVRCVDLVEVNPKIGTDADVQKTTAAAIEIIKAAFGSSRIGRLKSFEELQAKME